jgi:hypothetical protein
MTPVPRPPHPIRAIVIRSLAGGLSSAPSAVDAMMQGAAIAAVVRANISRREIILFFFTILVSYLDVWFAVSCPVRTPNSCLKSVISDQ